MTIGYGYWGLPAVERRIEDIERRKPRHWRKRLAALRAIRRRLLGERPGLEPVKGWRGDYARKKRYREMRRYRRSHTLEETGRQFGVTRQRVHEILRRGLSTHADR